MLKDGFVDMLCKVWHTGLTPKNVKTGFESTGIFPFDRTKYHIARLDAEKLSRYKIQKEGSSKDDEAMNQQTLETTNLATPSSSKSATQTEMQDALTCSTLTVFETSQNVIVNPSPSKSFPAGSFESILLTKIKRSAPQVRKRKRVDAESKVITSEEWIEAEKLSREQAAEKEMNKCQKRKSKAEKTGPRAPLALTWALMGGRNSLICWRNPLMCGRNSLLTLLSYENVPNSVEIIVFFGKIGDLGCQNRCFSVKSVICWVREWRGRWPRDVNRLPPSHAFTTCFFAIVALSSSVRELAVVTSVLSQVTCAGLYSAFMIFTFFLRNYRSYNEM
ncbi:hypothetical protein J6590_042614 [Homalodisca vitripennis]|nr:hypothetical protein J6590_042614 [Homalodisca vitripennis]